MTFSFVIPTYNNTTLLFNTLLALNRQTEKESYEVIVVDDGSTDGTRDHVMHIPRHYNLRYLYLERDERSCRARTRNHGWTQAAGEIVVFIDSDILIRPDYLAELCRCFACNERIAVIGNRLMLSAPVAPEEVTSGAVFHTYRYNKNSNLREFRYRLYDVISYNINTQVYPWTQFYSCNAAVPKRFLELAGGFDENFKGWGMEDVELGYALYSRGVNIVIDHKLEVLHQYHERGEAGRSDRPAQIDYERNINYFLKKHPEALQMPDEYKVPFFKGELADDSIFREDDNRYIGIDFRDKGKTAQMKKLLLATTERKKTILVVNDYVEEGDLDI
ncbi:MAG TPA: glycosyltransferase family 2 protein, partial [Spirochaetia bacterium]|nr:glycosyltransferase family 2 protein [Spirochaetia bacterium]